MEREIVSSIETNEIPGARELHDWFGYWPNFHDAEIVSLHLNRRGGSFLRVHTWKMTKEANDKGHYVLEKNVLVDFILEDITSLNLTDFNAQNVIFGLRIEKINSGYRLTLDACYGISGIIETEKLSIQIDPGDPSVS